MLSKKHRAIEIENGCRRNSLKDAVKYLLNKKANIDEVVKGCKEYSEKYGNPNGKISAFEVAFNMYVSALKNPKSNQIK